MRPTDTETPSNTSHTCKPDGLWSQDIPVFSHFTTTDLKQLEHLSGNNGCRALGDEKGKWNVQHMKGILLLWLSNVRFVSWPDLIHRVSRTTYSNCRRVSTCVCLKKGMWSFRQELLMCLADVSPLFIAGLRGQTHEALKGGQCHRAHATITGLPFNQRLFALHLWKLTKAVNISVNCSTKQARQKIWFVSVYLFKREAQARIKHLCYWLSAPGSPAAAGVIWRRRFPKENCKQRKHGSQTWTSKRSSNRVADLPLSDPLGGGLRCGGRFGSDPGYRALHGGFLRLPRLVRTEAERTAVIQTLLIPCLSRHATIRLVITDCGLTVTLRHNVCVADW